jgi:hypothetical protein
VPRPKVIVERLARIETEARTLAWSGKYSSPRAIELALVARGFAEAPRLFRNPWTRSELDRLCRQARRIERRDSRVDADCGVATRARRWLRAVPLRPWFSRDAGDDGLVA